MKTRRQHAAEDALTISRGNTQSPPVSVGNSEFIPIDLIIEILLRLSVKSIAKCRCVSKSWASILRREDFRELFITRSRARPPILLSCVEKNKSLLLSIPQCQKPDVIAANYIMRLPCIHYSRNIGSLCGLVCFTHIGKSPKTEPVICNPSTGQFLNLPHVKTKSVLVDSFLGFDPVDKQFKILSMTSKKTNRICEEYQVLTLGTKTKMSWRMIECCISHFSAHSDGICLNGVIYYVAVVYENLRFSIVCFDVRSEKLKVIKKAEDMVLWGQSTLVNYKGTLGALLSEGFAEVTGETKCFELWVLVDADKHEWSKHISISLPPLWKNIVADARIYFVGVTETDEIVLSPRYLSEPYHFYVYYYNIGSNTIKRVEIHGMDAFRHCKIHLSLNHVEDVKLLQYI